MLIQNLKYPSITDYRLIFSSKLKNKEFFNGTLEILGASFIADERTIFGSVSETYLQREIAWYLSESLSVADLEETPQIWKTIASSSGKINSNYGYLLWSDGNYNQYNNVLETLKDNVNSRQAVAIYTRPTMHEDAFVDGMKDFVCTNAVHYEIRENKLHVVVQMRSNDAVFGYKNDYSWQKYVQSLLISDLIPQYPQLEAGDIIWQVASLHVYERHFYLVDHYAKTGQIAVSPNDYKGEYGKQ